MKHNGKGAKYVANSRVTMTKKMLQDFLVICYSCVWCNLVTKVLSLIIFYFTFFYKTKLATGITRKLLFVFLDGDLQWIVKDRTGQNDRHLSIGQISDRHFHWSSSRRRRGKVSATYQYFYRKTFQLLFLNQIRKPKHWYALNKFYWFFFSVRSGFIFLLCFYYDYLLFGLI